MEGPGVSLFACGIIELT